MMRACPCSPVSLCLCGFLTTSRRGRFYLARAFYALALLMVLWTVYSSWSHAYDGELTNNQVQWFAISVFFS